MGIRQLSGMVGGWCWLAAGLSAVAALALPTGEKLVQAIPSGLAHASTPGLPGVVAPPQVVQELQAALAEAVQRFNAEDTAGVLVHVSDQYRSGPMTKTALGAQLIAMFQVYDAVRAQVHIDEVRLVGDQAWIYSTGRVLGLLPWLGSWTTLLEWKREPEVARREQGAWRLFGFQQ